MNSPPNSHRLPFALGPLLLLLCALSSLAADSPVTVTGTLRDRFGGLRRGTISFRPVDGATMSSPYIQPSWTVSTNSATNGTFTVTLLPGSYQVQIGPAPYDTFYAVVPTNSAGPFDLSTLSTNAVTSI